MGPLNSLVAEHVFTLVFTGGRRRPQQLQVGDVGCGSSCLDSLCSLRAAFIRLSNTASGRLAKVEARGCRGWAPYRKNERTPLKKTTWSWTTPYGFKLHSTKDDLLTPQWAREMAVTTSPFYFYTGGGRAKRPSHTSQRSAAPAVVAKMVAGAMAATGVRAAAAAGLGNRRWRRW